MSIYFLSVTGKKLIKSKQRYKSCKLKTLKELKNKSIPETMYACILQQNSLKLKQFVNISSLIIRPKHKQNSEHVKKDVVKNINPAEL